MKIIKTLFPANSILNIKDKNYDYVDSYRSVFNDTEKQITPTDIGKAFFNGSPKWIDALFTLRNKLGAVFGLKTSGKVTNRQQLIDNFKAEPGEQLGLFKVLAKTDCELVFGEDDKHLNFRVSFFLSPLPPANPLQMNLTITTTVEFNHWFGRLYFIFVRPFHKRIVPTMLKIIVKNIESQKKLKGF